MADIVLVVVSLAFFWLCVLYIRGCERLVKSTEEVFEPDEVIS